MWLRLDTKCAMQSTQVMGGVHLHVRTFRCTYPTLVSLIRKKTGRIALKFGVCLDSYQLIWRFTQVMGGIYLDVRTSYPFSVCREQSGQLR